MVKIISIDRQETTQLKLNRQLRVPSTKLAMETFMLKKPDKPKFMRIESNVPSFFKELSRLARSGELARTKTEKKVKRC